jgi:1,4-alpha-glucan branching enzyme
MSCAISSCSHRAGINVIMDCRHFPGAHGLAGLTARPHEHTDPRQGEHQDWGTLILILAQRSAQFLTTNALFWLDKYPIDGLRVDAVASMLYLDYSRQPDSGYRTLSAVARTWRQSFPQTG